MVDKVVGFLLEMEWKKAMNNVAQYGMWSPYVSFGSWLLILHIIFSFYPQKKKSLHKTVVEVSSGYINLLTKFEHH